MRPTARADKRSVANCVNCGAPLTVDPSRGILVCSHCGSEQEPPARLEYVDLEHESTSLCPLCATPLSIGRLEGFSLLCCARCSGMLIEMDCFAAVIDAVRMHEIHSLQRVLPRGQNPGDRVIACPSCGQPMLSHLYDGPGNVVIDSCERCQVNWLDPGELRRIAVAPDTARED